MPPNIILTSVRAEYSKESPLKSGAEIMPGMWLQYDGAEVEPHATAGAVPSPLMIADVIPFRPKSAGSSLGMGIDDSYDQAGETIPHYFPIAGDHLNSLLAAGEDVAIGDLLESAGDGTLRAGSSGEIARALEAVDNSAGYTAARVLVEVL